MTTPFTSSAISGPARVASGSHRETRCGTKARAVGCLLAAAIAALTGAATPTCAQTAETARALVAFPGAEGAGRFAKGGRGGVVIHVATLADDGPGSLRAAVEIRTPRIIVFDVSGTIALTRPLVVRHGAMTIAGQSAPGDGVTLRNYPLVIAADDVVVRYVRARLGDESGAEDDAITVTRGRRIILDHVSASWSVDETLSVASRYDPPESGPYDVSVQWSIISESLDQSRHAKGLHGYGTLVRAAHGARITFHHNLWAHHRARGPRPGNYLTADIDPIGPFIEFRSNVFYNWGGRFSGYDADTAQRATYNFIDNAYIGGPNSTGALAFQEENTLARAFFAGNTMNGVLPADPWSLVEGADRAGYRLDQAADVAIVAPDPASSAHDRVLQKAGASRARDAVDQRVVESVRSRTGHAINSQNEVGGWPALRSTTAPADTDQDGMPDAWERDHGLSPTNAGDASADRDADGYTNIEEYLNALAS